MFEAVRSQLKKDYHNGFIKPDKQGRHLRLQILQNTFHSHLHKHAVAGGITKDQASTFFKNMITIVKKTQSLPLNNFTDFSIFRFLSFLKSS